MSQRVNIFETCLNGALYPRTTQASREILVRLGYDVRLPKAQVCCGQMHFNSGYPDEIDAMLRSFYRNNLDADYVIFPSASCAAMVRENYPELAQRWLSGGNRRRLGELISRSFELVEFLHAFHGDVGTSAWFPHRATLHPTCHSLRSLRLGSATREILSQVEDIELIENPTQNTCCGFGGTFSIKNEATSAAMLADKVTSIRATGAAYVIALDNSCLMHISGGMDRARLAIRPIHIAEVLASTRSMQFC